MSNALSKHRGVPWVLTPGSKTRTRLKAVSPSRGCARCAKGGGSVIFLRSNDAGSPRGEALLCTGQRQALLSPPHRQHIPSAWFPEGGGSPQIQQVRRSEAHPGALWPECDLPAAGASGLEALAGPGG